MSKTAVITDAFKESQKLKILVVKIVDILDTEWLMPAPILVFFVILI